MKVRCPHCQHVNVTTSLRGELACEDCKRVIRRADGDRRGVARRSWSKKATPPRPLLDPPAGAATPPQPMVRPGGVRLGDGTLSLCLTRKPGEDVVLDVAGVPCVVSIDRVDGQSVRLRFSAEAVVRVLRREIVDRLAPRDDA